MKEVVEVRILSRYMFVLNAIWLIIVLGNSGIVYAESLLLPKQAQVIRDSVANGCPSCMETGFIPCGNQDIGFGHMFFRNFFLGQPATGCLLSYELQVADFFADMRVTPYNELITKTKNRFSDARLIVVLKDDYSVFISNTPEEVEVVIPEALHSCGFQNNKPFCCCCRPSCNEECCDKEYGSIHIRIRWIDPRVPDRKVEYLFYPGSITSQLYYINADRGKTGVRFCADKGGRGKLKVMGKKFKARK